ncbi:MAG: ROK family protein, partial [Thermoguttaceae bacterium]|nr:ROK family protein [Thermoguttaceae bacterium]
MGKRKRAGKRLYIGIDIGGTKIQAILVNGAGVILQRQRISTPEGNDPEAVLQTAENLMEKLVAEENLSVSDVSAIGAAVAGVVDPKKGLVVVTPNMCLSGVELGPRWEKRFQVPVAVGNDTNLGTLAERWLGAARNARSAFGIFVGTGIGGGLVIRNRIWRGAREAAAEIGHIVMEINGPQCGCGNRGCLEALASRTAIERQIRQAIQNGQPSILTELTGGELSRIRSGLLRQALAAGDPLVQEVLHRAAEVLGYACLTVRHLVDPELIILGGGVIEACGDFMVPIVQKIVEADRLPGARAGGQILVSALGDDAVALGAAAAAARKVGKNPLKKALSLLPKYPKLRLQTDDQITAQGQVYSQDFYVFASGKIKNRKQESPTSEQASSQRLSLSEIERLIEGGPEVVFVGTGFSAPLEVPAEVQQYLRLRAIRLEAWPTGEAIRMFNSCKKRKAALFHLS